MSTAIYAGVLGTFTVSSDQKPYLMEGGIEIDEGHEPGEAVGNIGGNAQGVKKSGRLTANLFSDTSTAIRAGHIDLSAAGLGSVDLLNQGLSRLALRIAVEHQMKGGAGEKWAFPIPTNRRFSGGMTVDIRSDDVPDLLVDMCSGTYADLNKTLDFTIAGTQIQLPVRLQRTSVQATRSGLQRFNLDFNDRSGRSGVTVLPSGNTTLLEKIINAWQTALAFEFQGKAATSFEYTGNCVFESAEVVIEDGRLVPIPYTFLTQGTVANAAIS